MSKAAGSPPGIIIPAAFDIREDKRVLDIIKKFDEEQKEVLEMKMIMLEKFL